jgi:peptidyl-prolyl cis-trans isomerase C
MLGERWRRLRRWLSEPLLQFLLIGAVLFLGYWALHRGPEAGPLSTRIEVTEDDLRQMSVAWLAQGRSAPTPEQMASLVDTRVREEILYREALALGLEKGDTIVKRRLAQKMEFLFEDVSALREPTREELKAWFEKSSDRFGLPPRASFRHLYFSPDRRGPRAREDAARALDTLRSKPARAQGGAASADPFMFQDYYGDRSPEEMAKLFGPRFAQALLQQPPGSWQGPIESGYGWHLVWVDSLTPRRVPAFEEVETEAKAEWIADQRAETRRRAYEAMRARYEIVLPASSKHDALAPGVPAVRKVP